VEDLTQFKGQELNFNIIEFDRQKRKFVAGRRELAAQEARQKRDEMFATLEVGQQLKGTVSRLVDFGAFIDLGGVDGLVHVSEVSWKRVRKVSDVLAMGDQVVVTVLAIDSEKSKISLTLKDINNDPWNNIEERYPVDSIVTGTVARLAAFGAFVTLEDGVDGLVHISQISNRRIARPEDVLTVGETIDVKVTAIDIENHKISLSKREADYDLGFYDGEYDEDVAEEVSNEIASEIADEISNEMAGETAE
jgi:4-hydroxy-3-methylbut-2-enyl diphosphate reductase